MKITVDRDPQYAPCGYLVCRIVEPPDHKGRYDWDTRDDENTVLVQTDWDYPGLASSFGFVPCDCGDTDGTVDCSHKTASAMIEAAGEFLDDCIDKQTVIEDPGYFA